MGDANITTSAWRLVEVGRVVLFNEGVYEGRLATIVEIIDHKGVRASVPSNSPEFFLCDMHALPDGHGWMESKRRSWIGRGRDGRRRREQPQ